MTMQALVPLKELLADLPWPVEFFPVDSLPQFLDRLYLVRFESFPTTDGFDYDLSLALQAEAAIQIPGLGKTAFVFGSDGSGFTLIAATLRVAKKTSLTLHNVQCSVRFDPSLLKPVTATGAPAPGFVSISTAGTIEVNSEFDVQLRGFGALKLPPAMIGDTGIIISADQVKLDLSRTSAIPEVFDAGLDATFCGVFIGNAKVKLPPTLPAALPSDLILKNCAFGFGGVSGQLTLDYTPSPFNTTSRQFSGTGAGELFGFPFALDDMSIDIHQNALRKGTVSGQVFLPFLEQVVAIDLNLQHDGSFCAAISPVQPSGSAPGGVLTFQKSGLIRMTIDRISLQHSGDTSEIVLSGRMQPLVGDLEWPEFEVRELAIDRAGRVRVEGGWIELPESKQIDLHGFRLELSKIGFGTEEATGENWIGFNGGVHLAAGLPLGASVEGLRILWDPRKDLLANPPRLELNGVGVSLGVPNVFSFEGKVAFFSDQDRGTKGFRGEIKLDLQTLKCTIEGKLVIGQSHAGYTFFYIYLSADLPAGIPLFNTGAAIYGFQGLLAINMEPNRRPDEEWYDGWYKRLPVGATATTKWTDMQHSIALGAGVSIGTLPDDGFSVNTKTLLILVLPGPIILLEGKGNFLKLRPGTKEISAEGAFNALLVLDMRQRIFQMNLEARYSFPKVINVYGGAEGFFNFDDPSQWHLFLGEKEPPEKRIQAKLLDLYGATAYWMMWKDRLEVGGWYGYQGGPWTFGPLSARVEAWMAGDGLISRNPNHFEAMIQLFGLLELRAFGAGVNINVDAGVAGRGPTPWEVDLWLRGTLYINLLFTKLTLEAEKRLHFEEPLNPQPAVPLLGMSAEHFKTDESWEVPVARGGTTIPLSPAPPIIPPDARPFLTFSRPMSDKIRLGMATLPDAGPEVIRAGRHEFRYSLEQVELLRNDGGWQPVSAAAYIASVPASNKVKLGQEIHNGTAYVGGDLISGGSSSRISAVDSTGITLAAGSATPEIGPCLLTTRRTAVTGTIVAADVQDMKDGSSKVSLSGQALPVDAYADGVLLSGGRSFTVIGNTATVLYVLNHASDAGWNVVPTAGSFTLSAAATSPLYGHWLPTDPPKGKTKLQLWTKTPYTFFRRNDSSVLPPWPYNVCGPDVREEPICVTFAKTTMLNGAAAFPGVLQNGTLYRIDLWQFTPFFSPLHNHIALISTAAGQALHFVGRFGSPPRVEFAFQPPLELVRLHGSGKFRVTANSFSENVNLSTGPYSVGVVQAGGKISTLQIQVKAEMTGTLDQICFLPGWTCTAIRPGEVPLNVADAEVAGLRFTSVNPVALKLDDATARIGNIINVLLPQLNQLLPANHPYTDPIAQLTTVAPQFQNVAGSLATSLPSPFSQLLSMLPQLQAIRQQLNPLSAPSPGTGSGTPSPTVPPPTLPPAAEPLLTTLRQDLDKILELPAALNLPSTLSIRFPEPVTRVRLALRARIGETIPVEACGGATKFSSTTFVGASDSTRVPLDVLGIMDGWIDRVEVIGLDPVIHDVCYDHSEFAWERKEQYSTRRLWRNQLEFWNRVDEVFDANADYCLRAITVVSNLDQPMPQQHWYGFFKTGSPPLGTVPGATTYPGGGVLAEVSPYVSRTVPESGAGQSGKVPPYRGYDVGVEFDRNYVDRLYRRARRSLQLRLRDNNGVNVGTLANHWVDPPEKRFTEGERRWISGLNIENSKRCGSVNWAEVPTSGTLLGVGEEILLAPDTLHRAELVSRPQTGSDNVVHQFEFTTSRFASFAHHIQSFEHTVWSVTVGASSSGALSQAATQALSSAADTTAATTLGSKMKIVRNAFSDLDTKARAAGIIGTSAQPTEQQFAAYEAARATLARAWSDLETASRDSFDQILGGIQRVQLPSVFEISLLRSATARLGLLLESPIPLEWRRMKLTIGRSATVPVASITPTLIPGADIVISGSNQTSATNYWLELLARNDAVLDGMTLKISADSSSPVFKAFYTFPAGTKVSAGDRIRVHAPATTARDPEIAYFAQEQTKLAAREQNPMPHGPVWLRLLSGSGEVINQRFGQPETQFAAIQVLDLALAPMPSSALIVNGDATRALILQKDQNALGVPAGSYRLEFEFRRNNGVGSLVLRRGGRSSNERTELRFLVPT